MAKSKKASKTTNQKIPIFKNAAVFAIVAYAMIAIMSDIFSNKTLSVFGLAVSGGMLLVPFSFVIRDLMHRLVGYKNALKFVVLTSIANLVMAVMLVLLTAIPAQDVSFGEAWAIAMGSSWRIIFASFVAQLLADLCDTWVFEAFTRKFGDKKTWLRCLLSNAVSIPVDSVVFILIGFGGVLPWGVIGTMLLTQIVGKMVIATAATPLAYIKPKDD